MTRHLITHAQVSHGDRNFTVQFKTDGIHVREKWQRSEKVIALADLVMFESPEPQLAVAANGKLANGSAAECLDLAACNLVLMSEILHEKKKIEREAIIEVKATLLKALQIIRSMEVMA